MLINNLSAIDGISFRTYLVSSEMDEVTSRREPYEPSDPRKLAEQRGSISKLRKLIQKDRETVLENIAKKGKKFDVLSALCYKCNNYHYMYTVDGLDSYKGNSGLSKELVSFTNFYMKILNMSNQLIGQDNFDKSNLIDVDMTFEDGDGKETSIVSTMSVVDRSVSLVPINKSTVISQYKIFLEFLYNIAVSLSPIKYTEKSVSEMIVNVLGYIWFLDTLMCVNNKMEGTSNYSYFTVYNDEDMGKLFTEPELNRQMVSGLTQKNIPICILDAAKKTSYKFLNELEDTEITTNMFVFARYIYKILNICGIDLFEVHTNKIKENGLRNYNADDIYDVIKNPDNPDSLINKVPSYKFLPSFYENTTTIYDWKDKTLDDIDNEYGIREYREFSSNDPIKKLINSSASSNILASQFILDDKGYRNLSKEHKDKELDEILRLRHFHKLLGTAENPNLLYKEVSERKYQRICMLEGPVSITYINNDISDTYYPISQQYEKCLESDLMKNDWKRMFTIVGNSKTNAPNFTSDLEVPDEVPDDTTIKFIEEMIKERVDKQATHFQNEYEKRDWNIPYRYNKTELVDVILASRRVDQNTLFVQLLGDAVKLKVKRVIENDDVMKADEIECVLRGDYRLVYVSMKERGNNKQQVVYTPTILVNPKTGEKELSVCIY